jgi:formamidopyrimidine-DNA glycosylase
MPELPEVETIVRSLQAHGLPGQQFDSARVYWDRTIATPSAADFNQKVAGQVVRAVRRRGKFIVIDLGLQTLLVHLRMSGDLTLVNGAASHQPQPHDRVVIRCLSGAHLVFNDPRKFGRMWLVPGMEEVTGSLGPEPLDPEFNGKLLYARLQLKRRMLKPLLMDQEFLTGLGNIYTDEALHRACLHPARLSDSLTPAEAGRLADSIRTTLQTAIENQGTSIDWVYRGGSYQEKMWVYHRTGQPCLVCGSLIKKIIIGQRSTHFCPQCQKIV